MGGLGYFALGLEGDCVYIPAGMGLAASSSSHPIRTGARMAEAYAKDAQLSGYFCAHSYHSIAHALIRPCRFFRQDGTSVNQQFLLVPGWSSK